MLGKLPSLSELLESPPLKKLANRASHNVVVERARTFLDDLRADLQSRASEIPIPSVRDLAERIAMRLLVDRQVPPRPVVNATGAIWAPGLCGPPLPSEAIEAMAIVGSDFTDLECAWEQGRLASREAGVSAPLLRITGAEGAHVTASYHGAVALTLAAVAAGREVVVSRGQIVEHRDGFRLQDAQSASDWRLHEVGTANVTRAQDVRAALNDATAAILNIWPDAFRGGGPSSDLTADDLVGIAHKERVPVIEDLGASCLTAPPGGLALSATTAKDRIAGGADIVLMRGDGLLGGPPCGVIVGRRELVERIARHPLARLLAASPATLAGLAAVLRLYANSAQLAERIPVLQLLMATPENLKNRASRLAPQLAACSAIGRVETLEAAATPIPNVSLTTWKVALSPAEESTDALAQRLWNGPAPVVGVLEEGRLVLDLRSVPPRHDQTLAEAIASLSPQQAESVEIPVRGDENAR